MNRVSKWVYLGLGILSVMAAPSRAQEVYIHQRFTNSSGHEVFVPCDGQFSATKLDSHGLVFCEYFEAALSARHEIQLFDSDGNRVKLETADGAKPQACDEVRFFPDGKFSCDSRLFAPSKAGWRDVLRKRCQEELSMASTELFVCDGEIMDTTVDPPVSLAKGCTTPVKINGDSVVCVTGKGVLGFGLFASTQKVPRSGKERDLLRIARQASELMSGVPLGAEALGVNPGVSGAPANADPSGKLDSVTPRSAPGSGAGAGQGAGPLDSAAGQTGE